MRRPEDDGEAPERLRRTWKRRQTAERASMAEIGTVRQVVCRWPGGREADQQDDQVGGFNFCTTRLARLKSELGLEVRNSFGLMYTLHPVKNQILSMNLDDSLLGLDFFLGQME